MSESPRFGVVKGPRTLVASSGESVRIRLSTRAKPSLNDYAKWIVLVNKAHGFGVDGEERDFGRLMALIHSEVSEALEEDRKGHAVDFTYYRESDGKPEGIPFELVDTIVRCLDILGRTGLDIDALLREKVEFNDSRPYKHGKVY